MSTIIHPIKTETCYNYEVYDISDLPLVEFEQQDLMNYWYDCINQCSKPQLFINYGFLGYDPESRSEANKAAETALNIFYEVYSAIRLDKKKPIIQIYTQNILLSMHLTDKLRSIAGIVLIQ